MIDGKSATGLGKSHIGLAPGLVLAAIVYGVALKTFFAQDDITFLARAAALEPADWAYRPLSAGLAFRLEYALFGLNPFGYHAVNLFLHLANVAGVYALGSKLSGSRAVGSGAAVLFGVSSVAFTPLHWATGVIELLTTTLLLGATLLHLRSRDHGSGWGWVAAAVALAAMLSKETAVAWILVVAFLELRSGPPARAARRIVPAAAADLIFVLVSLGSRHWHLPEPSAAYAWSASPLFLAQNLCTYLQWSVALNSPIRDAVALADPAAWRAALAVGILLSIALWQQRRGTRLPIEVGLAWWLAFLLPVIPLVHHTYLYYLYIPCAGGAIAVAAIGHGLLARWGRRRATAVALVCLAAYVLIEARNVEMRRSATWDALPVDRTLREATLLSHALPALARAHLTPGTRILFVNPVPRASFDLMTGGQTRPEDQADRVSYVPLEGAMRGGETLLLFLPGVVYLGFANTIPPGLEGAECFYYEQRGWLERLGHGQRALMRQAEIQMAARSWAAAESTYRRVRAIGDTLPAALRGQITALINSGRETEARPIAEEYHRRWPGDSSATGVRALLMTAQPKRP